MSRDTADTAQMWLNTARIARRSLRAAGVVQPPAPPAPARRMPAQRVQPVPGLTATMADREIDRIIGVYSGS